MTFKISIRRRDRLEWSKKSVITREAPMWELLLKMTNESAFHRMLHFYKRLKITKLTRSTDKTVKICAITWLFSRSSWESQTKTTRFTLPLSVNSSAWRSRSLSFSVARLNFFLFRWTFIYLLSVFRLFRLFRYHYLWIIIINRAMDQKPCRI